MTELKLPPLKQTILESAYVLGEITRILPTETMFLPNGEKMTVQPGDKLVVRDADRYLEVIFIDREEVSGPLVYTRDYHPTSNSMNLSKLADSISFQDIKENVLGALLFFILSLSAAAVTLCNPGPISFSHFLSGALAVAFALAGVYGVKQIMKCRRACCDDPAAYIRSQLSDITRSIQLPNNVPEITLARS